MRTAIRNILLAPKRTISLPRGIENLLPFSTEFTNGVWVKENVIITPNVTFSPEGTNTASLYQETTFTNNLPNLQYLTNTGNNVQVNYSIFAKANTANWLIISILGSGYAFFDLTGSVGSVVNNANSAQIQPFGNGWFRCSLNTTPFSSIASTGISYHLTTGNNVVSYSGNATRSIFVWGAQLNLTNVKNYLPTP